LIDPTRKKKKQSINQSMNYEGDEGSDIEHKVFVSWK
jgi:hypothetical protein